MTIDTHTATDPSELVIGLPIDQWFGMTLCMTAPVFGAGDFMLLREAGQGFNAEAALVIGLLLFGGSTFAGWQFLRNASLTQLRSATVAYPVTWVAVVLAWVVAVLFTMSIADVLQRVSSSLGS